MNYQQKIEQNKVNLKYGLIIFGIIAILAIIDYLFNLGLLDSLNNK